jgi:2-haloacid dehalogenase
MRKHYPWLWFDADNTLFDYNQSECIALKKAFQLIDAPFKDDYLDTYRQINRQLWRALEKHEITPSLLQIRRFELLLEATQLSYSANQLGKIYVEQLAYCAELIDGAHEVLHALHKTCRFAIVTNGLQDVQRSRVANSPIRDYISELIISEEIGVAKPKDAFFVAASARLGNPSKSDILMIGDSLTSDMRGGLDYGIDTCWFNPLGEPRPADIQLTYEIAHLRELLEMLE